MDLSSKKIAVTGASGMIGVYICRELLRRNAEVIGVVRNPDKAAFLSDEGVRFRQADLMDQASLTTAFDGCDVVVSNAAMFVATKMMGNWQAHVDANVTGTQNVYDAMRDAGIKRAVQVSTCGIYKMFPYRRFGSDTTQVNGEKKQGGPYRATKQLSEAKAWALSAEYGIDLTSVRPSGVYGARDINTLSVLYKAFKAPILPVPMAVIPLVHAADIAIAIAGALANDHSIGNGYVTGGTDATLYSFTRAAKKVLGKGPLLIPIPTYIGFFCDNSAAERDLGFINRPFTQGLSEIWEEEAPPYAV